MNITNALDLYPGGSQVLFVRTPTTLVSCLTIPARRHRALGCPVCRDVTTTQELTDCCYITQRNNEMRVLYLCLLNDAVELVRNRTGSELRIRGLGVEIKR